MNTKSWGYHLMLDISGCNPEKIRSAENIRNFAKDLVEKIDMVAYGEPQVIHFGEEDKMGYTLVQLIETSNICGHFCEEDNTAYLDIFSCKEYDIVTAQKVVAEYFDYKTVKVNYLERNAKSI